MTPSARRIATRSRIIAAAATAFRARGYAATGVDAVMSSAGLTHGGFYAHFTSKSALLDATLEHLREPANLPLIHGLAGLSGANLVATAIDTYLSPSHCAHPEAGCPIPTLGAELPRLADRETPIALTMVSGLARRLAPHLEVPPRQREGMAQALVALLVGGIVTARTLPAAAVDEWLSACRLHARRLAGLEHV